MKNLLIIIALILSALSSNAQTPIEYSKSKDSVMFLKINNYIQEFRKVEQSNRENNINKTQDATNFINFMQFNLMTLISNNMLYRNEAIRVKKESENDFLKIDKLERENVDLKVEISRLKMEIQNYNFNNNKRKLF